MNWYAGKQYDDCVRDTHEVLENLPKNFPGYQGQGQEIAGFVWWQGHKDQDEPYASRYEQNLTKLINALRSEFKCPQAPFVLATIGFEGWKLAGPGLTVANAQLAVANAKVHPEFAGNVRVVEARGFWPGKEESPNKQQGYHYYHNAETYFAVGESLGWQWLSCSHRTSERAEGTTNLTSLGVRRRTNECTLRSSKSKWPASRPRDHIL